jgi:ribosomal protein S21
MLAAATGSPVRLTCAQVIVKEGMSIDFAYKKLHRQVMGEAYPKKVKKAMTWITPTIRRRREKEYWLYQRYKAKMRWQRKQVEMKIATAKLRFD